MLGTVRIYYSNPYAKRRYKIRLEYKCLKININVFQLRERDMILLLINRQGSVYKVSTLGWITDI
jgi:hypothetical protein